MNRKCQRIKCRYTRLKLRLNLKKLVQIHIYVILSSLLFFNADLPYFTQYCIRNRSIIESLRAFNMTSVCHHTFSYQRTTVRSEQFHAESIADFSTQHREIFSQLPINCFSYFAPGRSRNSFHQGNHRSTIPFSKTKILVSITLTLSA